MASSSAPLVSVVIPVYNGHDSIAKAIRSVLSQTYDNIELTIANNCSSDDTLAVAEEFARLDPRVRIYNAAEHVPVVASYNRAFSLVSEAAGYCKILGADDWLFPNCITELVAVAEAHPTVGMVSSYVLRDSRVVFDGLPYAGQFWSGREIVRRYLLDNVYAFGGPSASLIRARVLREKRPFFNPRIFHGDTDAYLEMMQRYDFGFVYEVLSFQRRRDQPGAATAYAQRMQALPAAVVDLLTRFGPVFLTPQELEKRLHEANYEYYRMLAESLFAFREPEFWRFHRESATELGAFDRGRLARHVVRLMGRSVLNPVDTARRMASFARSRLARRPVAAVTPAPAPAPAPVASAPTVPSPAPLKVVTR